MLLDVWLLNRISQNPVNCKEAALRLTSWCQEVTMSFHKTTPQSSLGSPFQHLSLIKTQGLQHLKVELTVSDSQSAWLEDRYLWVLIRKTLMWFSQLVHCQDSTCQLQGPDTILQHLVGRGWEGRGHSKACQELQ